MIARPAGTPEFLRSVAFVSPQAGWALRFNGTILHTERGEALCNSSIRVRWEREDAEWLCYIFAGPVTYTGAGFSTPFSGNAADANSAVQV